MRQTLQPFFSLSLLKQLTALWLCAAAAAACVCGRAHTCSHPCYDCLFMSAHARIFQCEYVSRSVSMYAGHCMCVCMCVCVCVFSLPSTRDVRRVTLAALRRPAGRLRPIFSRRSLRQRPPFFDFALRGDGETERAVFRS